jgi:hypothetical protein
MANYRKKAQYAGISMVCQLKVAGVPAAIQYTSQVVAPESPSTLVGAQYAKWGEFLEPTGAPNTYRKRSAWSGKTLVLDVMLASTRTRDEIVNLPIEDGVLYPSGVYPDLDKWWTAGLLDKL